MIILQSPDHLIDSYIAHCTPVVTKCALVGVANWQKQCACASPSCATRPRLLKDEVVIIRARACDRTVLY